MKADPNRVPVPRAAVERLREIAIQEALGQAEARGILLGLGITEPTTGFDDGDEPAILLAPPPTE